MPVEKKGRFPDALLRGGGGRKHRGLSQEHPPPQWKKKSVVHFAETSTRLFNHHSPWSVEGRKGVGSGGEFRPQKKKPRRMLRVGEKKNHRQKKKGGKPRARQSGVLLPKTDPADLSWEARVPKIKTQKPRSAGGGGIKVFRPELEGIARRLKNNWKNIERLSACHLQKKREGGGRNKRMEPAKIKKMPAALTSGGKSVRVARKGRPPALNRQNFLALKKEKKKRRKGLGLLQDRPPPEQGVKKAASAQEEGTAMPDDWRVTANEKSRARPRAQKGGGDSFMMERGAPVSRQKGKRGGGRDFAQASYP